MSNRLNHLHAVIVWRAKGSFINFFTLQVGQRMIVSSLLHILLCFPKRCSLYLRWSSNRNCSWVLIFFQLFNNGSGWSKILSCWRPPIRTKWACHRAALAGKQVSTPRQDPRNKTSRTDLLASCERYSKPAEEQALRCHVPRWLFPEAPAAAVLGPRKTTCIRCALDVEGKPLELLSL